jgi:hypothetical protein
MIYVDRIDQAAEQLELREVDSGTNVILAAGDYDVGFERIELVDGLRFAAPSQVTVDLLTAPAEDPPRHKHYSIGWGPMKRTGDPELLIAARSVLLDALEALRLTLTRWSS